MLCVEKINIDGRAVRIRSSVVSGEYFYIVNKNPHRSLDHLDHWVYRDISQNGTYQNGYIILVQTNCDGLSCGPNGF